MGCWVQDFKLFMDDDAALLKAANAQWAVTPLTDEGRLGTEPTTEPAVMICDDGAVSIGASRDCSVVVSGTAVSFPPLLHRSKLLKCLCICSAPSRTSSCAALILVHCFWSCS